MPRLFFRASSLSDSELLRDGAAMLNEATISSFRASLLGGLIEPGDPSYEASRKVYNSMIDRHPRLIARCADVADVMAAVNFGREQKLLVAIRGGGHNAGGLGWCDGGLGLERSEKR